MRQKSEATKNALKKFVEEFILENSRSPHISEIAVGIGSSKGTVYRYLVEMNGTGMLTYNGKSISTEVTQKINSATTSAPVVGSIACGTPTLAEENIEEYINLPVSMLGKGKFFILRASGESMIEAGIDSGDLVIVRQQKTAENGEIVVALVENETTLKRFYRDNEHRSFILHPENRTLKDIEVKRCDIQGVAVKVIKDLM